MTFPHAPTVTLLLAATMLASCSSQATTPSQPSAPAKPAQAVSAEYPAVVELYQSQGCSSCPPANANINAISDRPDVLALSFAVTYWDKLGWKDRFAHPDFTARQWDYALSGGRRQVYTPQVIVNGKTALVGNDRVELDRLIASSGRPVGGPAITAKGSQLTVAGGKPGATVWLVQYDPASREVPIASGENSGRTLPHRHIVTKLVKLGVAAAAPKTFTLPTLGGAGLKAAVFVQASKGGPIIAAKRLPS